MCGFAAAPLGKVRIGLIGVGARGSGAVSRLAKFQDVEVVALCDLFEERTKGGQATLMRNGRKPAQLFFGSENAWKKLVELDLDLIYICTPWQLHTPMAVLAMANGKHAAVEVPAATTLEECWQLVETSEKTGRHCMMLENCCYDFFELLTLNMVRQGVFGQLTHAEGAYIHDLAAGLQDRSEPWRLQHNIDRNGNLYPTHGLGPIAQCLDINRGNRFDYLTSISSQEAAFTAQARRDNKPTLATLPKYRGDMNTSVIKCANGQTVMVQHDISTPRPYSRIHLLQGSDGCAMKWPEPERIALASVDGGHRWLTEAEMLDIQKKYAHPLDKTIGEIAKKVGGHGGMDVIMDYRLIYCLKLGLPLDQDVYDAAAWSAVTPLSAASLKHKGDSRDFPDFTRNRWKSNAPLAIVDVEPAKLPLIEIKKDGSKQLAV
jgi:predicted dehydrogenase